MDLLTTIELDLHQLATVIGGTGAVGGDNALGRCGPGTRWSFLGNIYTPECKAHDVAVRTAEASGTPKWLSHLEALPLLPAAVGSWVKAKLAGQ